MAKKVSTVKKAKPTLGAAVMVFSKSSTHACALVGPEFVTIEGLKFIQGIQSTGKEGHRMEKKRTLIPFDHVASIVEFATEEDLWSEPQPRHLRLAEEQAPTAPLTSHEQGRPKEHYKQNRPHHRDRNDRNRQGNRDARFQERHDFSRNRDFDR